MLVMGMSTQLLKIVPKSTKTFHFCQKTKKIGRRHSASLPKLFHWWGVGPLPTSHFKCLLHTDPGYATGCPRTFVPRIGLTQSFPSVAIVHARTIIACRRLVTCPWYTRYPKDATDVIISFSCLSLEDFTTRPKRATGWGKWQTENNDHDMHRVSRRMTLL